MMGYNMANLTDKAIEQLQSLTLLEAADLARQMEEAFGVSGAASVGGMMIAAHRGAAVRVGGALIKIVEDQTAFNVVLEEVPADKRVAVLKVVRSLTGLGLKEAKELVDTLKSVREGVTRDEAEAAKKELEYAGAKVHISELENSQINKTGVVIEEIDNILVELSSADCRIAKNQVGIDSLKIETQEMLTTLHATVD
jgi:large subunit ribosomal protein L7/L12